jgi:hypothetical protein
MGVRRGLDPAVQEVLFYCIERLPLNRLTQSHITIVVAQKSSALLQVAAEPLEVLGPTARLRQVLQPLKALQADTALSVDNLSMVRRPVS